jgi:hypothetical protein
MAGIAKHQRTEELHPANEANPHEKYLCPHCDAPASHVRSHIRDTPSGDSTRVKAHFRFYDCEHGMQTERSASADNSSGGGSGESPLHDRRKVQAMNVLLDKFETERYATEFYIGKKRCDAVVLLTDPHEKYGKGFVVEYQHKNEQKDIEATERHYASHNFTTLWLWEDQFTFSGLVPDVDLFGGRVFKPWPQVVPDCEEWSGTANRHRLRAMIGAGTTTRVDATLKRSFVLMSEQEYWNQTGLPESNSTSAQEYLNELKSEYSEPLIKISFTQWLSEDFWRIAYFRGIARRSGLLERGHEKNPNRPPKPANPFDDIQCQNCGHYKPVSDASQVCEHCSTLYDLSWNVETGRVSSDSVKEHILSTQATDD